MDEITRNFLRQAYIHAKTFSHDLKTQNAAIIIDIKGEVIAMAANEFPAGIWRTPDRLERPAIYDYILHAEHNAILHAAILGHRTWGGTMYCPWAPCLDCAGAIIQAGLSKVIAHKEMHDRTPEKWVVDIEQAVKLLTEAGVRYERVSGSIGKCDNTMNFEKWYP